ncbi:MAG: hypothetical protein LBD33_02645 [Puniceicoccales bacterium]|jgi:hypothetical protein|nr:hypothetical protein [Puniceicoccales bacterium]
MSEQKLSKAEIRRLVADQLLAANPASLSVDVIARGLGCVAKIPHRSAITDVLDDMLNDRTVVKIVEDQFGPRFSLVSKVANSSGEYCND